jgi:hypothetical protein
MAVRLAAFAPAITTPYRDMPHLELTEDEKLALRRPSDPDSLR